MKKNIMLKLNARYKISKKAILLLLMKYFFIKFNYKNNYYIFYTF